ncbi:hypothetical protein KBB27_01710, partial [Patescibacteria group bacterium]|nr:hypothetical protein [Patescibacteria group bacterium]
MQTKKLVIAVAAFLIALLVPSCAPTDLGAARAILHTATIDASLRADTSQDAFSPDVFGSNEEDTSSTSPIESTDGGIVDSASAIEDAPPVDPRYATAQAFLLSPTTCSGQRIALTPSQLDLFDHGYTLWHLCYKTPSPRTSDRTIARLRANEVILG